MEIKKFIFIPDGHYGYPQTIDGDTPRDYHTLVEEYCDSPYSAWGMGEYHESEPEEDDYETEEEYNEAYAEWEENQESNKVDCYDEWGSYDVFGNSYEMLSDGVDPEDIFLTFFNYDGTSCHDDFMREAAETEGVIFVISKGNENQIAMSGKVYDLESVGNLEGEGIAVFLSDVIVDEFRKKNVKAGLIYKGVLKSIPEVREMVASKITPEEMIRLENLSKGGSALRKFGFDF